jgi:hypothetical protein
MVFTKGHPYGKRFKKGDKTNLGRHPSQVVKDKISKTLIAGNYKRENCPAWNGGKTKHTAGYVMIHSPNHPFRNHMNYVFEHRLVIEKQLGRYLKPEEIPHHLGDKTDNRPEMLMAFINNSAHMRFHRNPKNINPKEIIFDGRKLTQ